MKGSNVLVCLGILSVISGAKCVSYGNTVVVDEMRNELLEMSKTLENDIIDPWLKVSENVEDEEYLRLIKIFKSFGDKLERSISTSGYEYLKPLNSVWLWARAENELKAIDGLYRVFRMMQYDIIDGKARLDIQKLVDFLEIVLHDPNASIVRTLVRIGDLIVHEKLFVSAYQVHR